MEIKTTDTIEQAIIKALAENPWTPVQELSRMIGRKHFSVYAQLRRMHQKRMLARRGGTYWHRGKMLPSDSIGGPRGGYVFALSTGPMGPEHVNCRCIVKEK